MRIAGKIILLASFAWLASCTPEKKDPSSMTNPGQGLSFKWSRATEALLRDSTPVNQVVDSLKQRVLLAKSDTEAINLLNELSQNWKNDPNLILANEAIAKSKSINYTYGEVDGQSRLGYYFYWIDEYAAADSILLGVLARCKTSDFKRIQVQALTGLGKVARITGEFDKGLSYFQNALKASVEMGDKNQSSFCLNCIGEVYRLKGENVEALYYFQQALDISKQTGDKNRIASSLSSMGDIYRIQDDYSSSLDYFQRALNLSKQTGDKPLAAFCLNGMGEVYRIQGDYKKGLKYFMEAERIAEKLGDKTRTSSCLSSIGDCYRNIGNFTKALDFYNQTIAIAEEIDDKSKLAFCYNGIGEIYVAKKDKQKGLEYFIKSLNIAKEIEDKTLIAECLNSVGTLYFDLDDYANAKKYAEECMPRAKECNTPMIIQNAAELSYHVYEKTGDFKKAFEMHNLAIQMKDSVVNRESMQRFAAQEFKAKEQEMKEAQLKKEIGYKTEQVKKEAELKQQKLVRNGFIIGAALLCGLVFIVFRSLQQSKKANRIIFEQKKQVEAQKAITEQQKLLVEEKQVEIMDSIRYAKNIQQSLFPTEKYIEKELKRLMGKG